MKRSNWFDQGGSDYARFRPDYPPALSHYLAGLPQRRGRALDAGCGTGQFTVSLADHFAEVIGLDPSGDQIGHARPHARVTYLCAPAEAIPVDDHGTDLITAAQAAHWFDRPAFYAEVRRIAAPGAVIALLSYGVPHLDGAATNDRFARFYHDEIGPFWPPERKLVDSGYAGIDFPFSELPAPTLTIERDWQLGELLGYISTWSAIRAAVAAGREDILTRFARDLAALWGPEASPHRITWPINLRIGRI